MVLVPTHTHRGAVQELTEQSNAGQCMVDKQSNVDHNRMQFNHRASPFKVKLCLKLILM